LVVGEDCFSILTGWFLNYILYEIFKYF